MECFLSLTLLPHGFEMSFQVRNLDPFNHVYLPVFFLLNTVEVSSQEGTIIEGPFRKAHMMDLHTGKEEVAMSGIMTGRSLQAYFVGVNGPMTITDPKNVQHETRCYIHLIFTLLCRM